MPFIKIMGKKDNKKKVKKANVKEFPVDSALEQEKKNLNSKSSKESLLKPEKKQKKLKEKEIEQLLRQRKPKRRHLQQNL